MRSRPFTKSRVMGAVRGDFGLKMTRRARVENDKAYNLSDSVDR